MTCFVSSKKGLDPRYCCSSFWLLLAYGTAAGEDVAEWKQQQIVDVANGSGVFEGERQGQRRLGPSALLAGVDRREDDRRMLLLT